MEERFSTLVFSGFPGSRPPCRAGTLAERRRMRESLFSSTLRFAVVNSELCARREAGEGRRCVGEEVVGHKKSEVWITKSVPKM